ncbi:MAG: hypothetical protein ACTHOR_15825 [Devosia sp.]|jgi:hypothetical protein|nr:hypothetical protein [Devosiaceae bacterium]
MPHMASVALPVLPGKAERFSRIGSEIARHQAEWDRLCRDTGGFRFYNVTLQQSPMGDLGIYSMVVEDPSKVRTAFGRTAYDQWWLEFVEDVHGIDLRNGVSLPPSVFTWQPAYAEERH